MITKKDIIDFFNKEAETAKQNWDALMQLPIEERVAKRKAIKDVYLDKEQLPDTEENYKRLRLKVTNNISDFKEGDPVLLHKEGNSITITCNINSFEDDGNIIVEVFPRNLPYNLDIFYDTPLLLDKDTIDLRPKVYNNFTATLSSDTDYWHRSLLNNKPLPSFRQMSECETELEDTISNFGLNLLPRQKEAILKSMATENYYMIQGPPGTGKSYVLSLIILEELLYFNHRVIIIGPNHMAINNALKHVVKTCPPIVNLTFKVGQSYNAPDFSINYEGEELCIKNIHRLNVQALNEGYPRWIVGLTPHSLYTSRARDLECDTLIIDEAGQMTIPLALMGMIKTKKVIFAGDYKQLPPIVSTYDVKEELTKSVFEHLVSKENCTMLDYTFRMCDPICRFVSELFYNGEVLAINQQSGDKVICHDRLYSFDSPVVLLNVNDHGKQTSDLEAGAVTEIIAEYINDYGLESKDIAVLSPFRAQCANIRRHIRNCDRIKDGDRRQLIVDTIDKLQGQEREVIIVSMAAGDIEYMTEMADFLYNPNKLNVAFSRAKSKLIIVANADELHKLDTRMFPHIEGILNSEHINRLEA